MSEWARHWLEQRLKANQRTAPNAHENEEIEALLNAPNLAEPVFADIWSKTRAREADGLPLRALQALFDAMVEINTHNLRQIESKRAEVDALNRDIEGCLSELHGLIERRNYIVGQEGIATDAADWPDEIGTADRWRRHYFDHVIFNGVRAPSAFHSMAARGYKTPVASAVRTILERFARLPCNRQGAEIFPSATALANVSELLGISSDDNTVKKARGRWMKEYRTRE